MVLVKFADMLLRCARTIPAVVLLTSLSFVLAACASQPTVAPISSHEYLLGAGDKIQVTVFGQTDLSGLFTLDASGSVSLPKAGVVQLKDQTLRQAEQLIAQRLTAELNKPEVNVNIAEYRPIYVMGEVQRPGQFSFEPGMTVLNAVALASGYKERADRSDITIVRASDADRVEKKATESTQLEPGDTVTVQQRWF